MNEELDFEDDGNYRNQPLNPNDKWWVAASAALLVVFLIVSLVQ